MPGRIGILGGTFDPFHLGHLALARAARTALQLDEVRIVPSNVPPHRAAPGASSYHRFAMAALGIAGEPGLVLDDIEMGLDGPSFTTTTLARLHDKDRFTQLAERLGLPTPTTVVARSDEELREGIERFPRYFARAAFSRGGVSLLTNTGPLAGKLEGADCHPVSYTHLTLPTICSV